MNIGAGSGDLLYVTLKSDAGRNLLFAIDTGSPFTLLDKSLESSLGIRLGSTVLNYTYMSEKPIGGIYFAPKLYLGNARLATGLTIRTDDLHNRFPTSRRKIDGILGIDCLRNYCVQFDFVDRKIRFFDPIHIDTNVLGKRFNFKYSPTLKVVVNNNFLGLKDQPSEIDTGTTEDGKFPSLLFKVWTNIDESSMSSVRRGSLTNNVFDGDTYSDLEIYAGGTAPTVGLRFLARNLVTINFPLNLIYLKRTSSGPLPDNSIAKSILGLNPGWWDTAYDYCRTDAAAIAKAMLSGPNLHPDSEITRAYALWLRWSKFEPIFKRSTVSIGQPPIDINILELAPGNYHVNVTSKMLLKPNGNVAGLQIVLEQESKAISFEPRKEKGIIFLLHDYTSQKEFMFPWAFYLAKAGYRVVLTDLRGHGESTGNMISYGHFESTDLKSVLDKLASSDSFSANVGVVGVGYGANIAIDWAAIDSRICSIVAIAPYSEYNQTFARFNANSASPISTNLISDAITQLGKSFNVDLLYLSARKMVAQLKFPIFFIGGGTDIISYTNDILHLERISPSGSKSLLIPEANHHDIPYWFFNFGEPVISWFDDHLSQVRPTVAH